MAQNVTNWVWKHSQAVNAARIVLLAIAHEANRDGSAEMSIQELASKCILGERTVQGAVKDLTASGELRARAGTGRGHLTRYWVLVPNPADSAPFTGVKGAESAPFTPETPQDLHPLSAGPVDKNPAESAPFTGRHRRSGATSAGSAPFTPVDNSSDVSLSSTGLDEVQVKDVPAVDDRPDVARICAHLADRIEANGSKRPAITTGWRNSARLMIDRDGRTEQQIMTAIDWCQDNEFWRANILSMPKLREKYEQLRLQARRASNGRPSTTNDRVRQAREAGRRVQAMLEGDS